MKHITETTYDPAVHNAAVKECGKNRGNGGGWNAEKKYRTACKELVLGYETDSAVIAPLRKRYRSPSPRWPGNIK